ncbi:hypothetical protein E2C01_056297 [Portunus trituberculatus]|uniref:Uncharacterized protein n=1 Tax=Portunus trituberculatus TaxID=210409 RepID=A0A5B7H052_PORTR|nr:hypothetical protein [Portunus trituberculatus]
MCKSGHAGSFLALPTLITVTP